MGCNQTKPDPSYIYLNTCKNHSGMPCSKTYVRYQSDGRTLQKSVFVGPYRYCDGDENRSEFPEYVAAMVIKHPKNPSDITKFEADCLDEHNVARGRHGVDPLKLSRKLCKYATEWANELAKSNRMKHRPDSKYGENLYMACGREVTGRDPVRAWALEMDKYDFNDPQFKQEAGHFTQVIWRTSKKLGVGMAKSNKSTFIVCNYDPPGNIDDDYIRNVPPPL